MYGNLCGFWLFFGATYRKRERSGSFIRRISLRGKLSYFFSSRPPFLALLLSESPFECTGGWAPGFISEHSSVSHF
jgi:hypothetical protein